MVETPVILQNKNYRDAPRYLIAFLTGPREGNQVNKVTRQLQEVPHRVPDWLAVRYRDVC